MVTGGTVILQSYLTWWTDANGDTLNDIYTNNFALNLEGLPAGNYTVAVEDDHGCFYNESTFLAPSVPLAVSATNDPILCAGASAAITPSSTGGVPYAPVTFEVNGAPLASSYPQGMYTITAKDAKGCTASTVLTITEPSVFPTSITVTACNSYLWNANGQTYTVSGTYSAIPSGCNSAITLNLTILDNTQSTTNVTAYAPYTWVVNGQTFPMSGTYTATSLNAAGCVHTHILILTLDNNFSINVIVDQPISCHGNDDGTATGEAFGDGPFLFGIDGGPITSPSNMFIGLNPGTHTICAKDIHGNVACGSALFIEPVPISITFTTDSVVSCNGNDGAVSGIISGGTIILQSYVTVWTNQAGDTLNDQFTNNFAQNLTDMPAGTYNVAVEDDNGCFYNEDVVLPGATPIQVSASFTSNGCSGNNVITFSAIGGVPYSPLTYMINGAPVAAAYPAGTYTVTATDEKGCTGSTMVTISGSSSISTNTNASACNVYVWSANGNTYTASGIYTAQFTSANGCDSISVLNLTILLSTSSTQSITECGSYTWNGITYTASGTYTYTSINAAGCVHTATLVLVLNQSTTNGNTTVTACNSYIWNGVTYTASGVYTKTSLNSAGCPNTATLILTINSTVNIALTASACTSYSWFGITYTISGVYTHSSTNSAGCIEIKTLTLTISPLTSVSVTTPTSVICSGASTSLTATGGTSFIWMPGSLSGSTVTVSPVSSTTYTVTASNAAGCTRTATKSISVLAKPTVTISASSNTICAGSNVTLSAGGASSYSWTPGGSTGSSLSVSPLVTTTYTVTGMNSSGCTNTATKTITVNPLPAISISVTSASICLGSSTVITAGGANTYSWMPGSLSGTSVTVTPTSTKTYTVTGTSTSGCTKTSTRTITVNALPTVTIATSDQVLCAGSPVTLTGGGASTYNWAPGTLTGTSITVSPTATTTYTVTGMNASGCTKTATRTIAVNQLTTAGSQTITSCNSYSWNGVTYTESGIYTFTSLNNSGCTNTATLTLTINSCSPVYPGSPAYSSSKEYIKTVQFNSISNVSGNDNGYGNYLANSTTVIKGTIVPITLKPGFETTTVYTEYWRVWIDWNYDGDWSDAGEMVAQGTSNSTASIQMNVQIPTTAVTNMPVHMRVIMRRGQYAPNAVVAGSGSEKGEVEDYTVVVSPVTARLHPEQVVDLSMNEENVLSEVNIYPNPVSSGQQDVTLTYELSKSSQVKVSVYLIDGKRISVMECQANEGENRNAIHLPVSTPGIYTIIISCDGVNLSRKLLVR